MQSISEKIKQRRFQMLVHSYLYYELDTNLVTDYQWSKWAKELVVLQNENPEIAKEVEYAECFEGWEGSSGAFLPYNSERIKKIAERLLKIDSTKLKKPSPKNEPKQLGLF